MQLVYWRLLLRDVREQLKADALARLRSACPTLASLGWFTKV